ncbi:hypothetical protein CBR_g8542 [Chara braunii]|uniref:Lambda-carrageenase beta-propeller domain-containing protein n=1 Tax=Chara braunii TaxID=69332 RepID=A0A388KMF2_CHABU|nr:hypothetical protein CBR_g8542 [Chara braunii]|eukprot:GBG71239.1 hypothetical protein CBR_g8542 [Chara braunii]
MMASTRKPRRAICAVSEASDDVGIPMLQRRRRWMRMGGVVGLDLLLLTSLFLLISVQQSVEGQLSFPVAKDSDLEDEQNEFQQRRASLDRHPIPKPDEAKFERRPCPHNLHLRWTTEVSSSIYATPLIADINNDGRQEVVVPTFVHYLEALDGSDGEKVAGWPAYHRSTVHSSPLLYDIDSDGVREIVMATYDGEIMFIKPNGEVMMESITIPRLRIKKDWYVGLAEDPVDHSRPDIGEPDSDALKFEGFGANQSHGSIHVNKEKVNDRKDIDKAVNAAVEAMKSTQQAQAEAAGTPKVGAEVGVVPGSVPVPVSGPSTADKPVVNQQGDGAQANAGTGVLNNAMKREHPAAGADPNLLVAEGVKKEGEKEGASQGVQQGHLGQEGGHQQGASADVARMRRRNLLQDKASEIKAGTDQIPGVENMENLDEDGTASFDVFKDGEEEEGAEMNDPGLEDEYRYDYDDALNDDMWRDEGFEEARHIREANEIEVDAHVLCTPVIADIDNDGVDELVVAVSYFFDREYYDDSEHRQELGKDIEPGNYVAGGIAVFDLQTKKRKWHVHLDLTTDRTSYRAYIYSSPTVIDLDGDDRLEVIVGTGLGYIYMLNSDGTSRKNSPLQMGEIQGQVVAADVNDDGFIELVACDTRGSIAVISWQGQILWERHVHSLISQGATVGDVDGDGSTDIVFGTSSGHIYAMTGKDGKNLTHFPFRTHGRIMAPVLLTNFHRTRHLDLVVLGFDGYLYMINGASGCADTLDIGETSRVHRDGVGKAVIYIRESPSVSAPLD